MNWKLGTISSFALIAATSMASFELGLVDQGTFGISRIDVTTGAYLGTFAQSVSGRVGMSIDPTTPGTVVLPVYRASEDLFGYIRYNYSTGEAIGFGSASTTSFPVGMTALSSGNLAFWMDNLGIQTISIRNKNMGIVQTLAFPVGTNAIVDYVELANGASVALTRRNGTQNGTYRFDLNFYANPNVISPITQVIRDNAVIDRFNSLDFLGGLLAVGGSTNTDSEIYSISGTQATLFSEAFGTLRSSGGIAFGHGGTFSTLGLQSGTDIILAKAHVLVPDLTFSTLGGIPKVGVFDYDIVVAPEPTTLLILGLGASVAGLRRRAK